MAESEIVAAAREGRGVWVVLVAHEADGGRMATLTTVVGLSREAACEAAARYGSKKFRLAAFSLPYMAKYDSVLGGIDTTPPLEVARQLGLGLVDEE